MKHSIFSVVLCLFLAAPVASVQADAPPPVVKQWIDAYQRFDLDGFLGFYADDVLFEDPTARITFTSKQQLRSAYTAIMQGRWGGNYHFDVKSVVQDGDKTVLEGVFSLTFNGERADIRFTTWLEFEHGKIKRQLDMFDYNELQRQLPGFGQSFPSEYSGPQE